MEVSNTNHLALAWRTATELTAAITPTTKEDTVTTFDFLLDHLIKVLKNYPYPNEPAPERKTSGRPVPIISEHEMNSGAGSKSKKTKGGRQIPIVSQEEIQSRLDDMLRTAIQSQGVPKEF